MGLDEAGFLEFVSAHQPALTRLARAICLNWSDADDVTQEALIRVGLRWGRLSRRGQPLAYTRQVIARLAIDQARRRSRELSTDKATTDGSPDSDRYWVEEAGWIRQALEPLPPQQRAAIALRYLAGRDDREIAQDLGCSQETVRSHVSLGIQKIRVRNSATGSNDG